MLSKIAQYSTRAVREVAPKVGQQITHITGVVDNEAAKVAQIVADRQAKLRNDEIGEGAKVTACIETYREKLLNPKMTDAQVWQSYLNKITPASQLKAGANDEGRVNAALARSVNL